jgi:streptogramin lyase
MEWDANSQDLGNGFRDHGVATPVSNHRGTVATVDGEGRNVVLLWLYDHRGGYALLLIDVETGRTEQFPMPFDQHGDGPFASVLSSRNRFYSHFGSHFVEFDPAERAFTFHHQTVPQMAMSMTEDDAGRIWSGTYPNSAVACYDPGTGAFRDYGNLYAQNWRQYPRAIAADDTGWIYFGIGSTASQIIALDPESGAATPLLAEEERAQAHALVYRDMDGKVYGHPSGQGERGWMALYQGRRRDIARPANPAPRPIIEGSQGLFHRDFPDGERLRVCDLIERRLVVEDPATGASRQVRFDYASEGAHLMGVARAPNGTICGGTAFPMRFFSYDPSSDRWINREALGQYNTVAPTADRFWIGAYTQGLLEEWNPAEPWVATERGNPDSNPVLHCQCGTVVNRPHDLLPFPDGRTVVLAGTPGYGLTGGGLLLWDVESQSATLLEHADLLPQHSTMSLALLADGSLLGGSTVSAGTGGEEKAEEAELYILDMESKRIVWHEVVFAGVHEYTDLCVLPDGRVLGVADQRRFFVFDPATRSTVHEQDLEPEFGLTTSQQGPRVFVAHPDGRAFMLFRKGIAEVDLESYAIRLLAESPISVGPGGDYLDGRIYFGSGSHLYSYELPGR